ncbi:hypothetical protein E2C01_097193 [Portunus trituberculatus]|uniref:Uncharacterized protein n=1 Tax=Portunus trituberculatus TaxID=210409 RepID=A0A5B7K409_PORTR|nr:hypothetical protein [Portunus trituberculatus]
MRDKDGRQRAVRQPLKDYWHEGVTARINNSRDVHKPPLPAGEVTSAALKVLYWDRGVEAGGRRVGLEGDGAGMGAGVEG